MSSRHLVPFPPALSTSTTILLAAASPLWDKQCNTYNSQVTRTLNSCFLLLLLLLFLLEDNVFQYCGGLCHTSVWISYNYICISSILSLPTPNSTPPGHHRVPGWLLVLYISFPELFVSHTAVDVCQCYFLSSSHVLCPQVHSLCLCLCSFPAHRFISTIFLDSI